MKQICLLFILSLFSTACTHLAQNSQKEYKTALEYSRSKEYTPGRLVVVQGPTSDRETNINVLSPVLKKYKYVVKDSQNQNYDVEHYDTVHTSPVLWKVDKLHIKGLKPGVQYSLEVVDEFRGSQTKVDQRYFNTVDTKKENIRFAYASCMADDYRFNEVIDPMWEQMRQQNLDLVILNGDVVYVDSFEFVERKKATELDVWFRFIDSLQRLPIYHWTHLKPIFSTWDDHDFGTNDGDRDFISKKGAKKVFLAFFGGKNIENVYKLEDDSVYSLFNSNHQKMLFIDDRYFRQPNKDQKVQEKYGHWGEKQHHWIMSHLNDETTPVWIFNGNQVFSGNELSFKESMQSNHPEHFKLFTNELKNSKSTVVFASGDIHFSEIMAPPQELLGYQTYEITSSSMHSYTGDGWDNPLRVPGAFTKEFNFMIINSRNVNGSLLIDVESWGLKNEPYFKKSIQIKK